MRKLHFAISKIAIPMTPAMEYLRGCQADQASTKQTPIGTGGVLSLLRTAHQRHEILVVPCIVCASRECSFHRYPMSRHQTIKSGPAICFVHEDHVIFEALGRILGFA